MRQLRVEQVSRDGGVATLIGVDTETGERIAAYADGRMADAIAEAVAEAEQLEDLPVCDVEPWQVAGYAP